ncbi:ABC transporter permease [Actinomadura graeca]|uniref:ABC transporter permease n=1 Tax=Actinomadura graeca TaxID=2750812 RepID=A0ABX8QM76_9ACTN|nr:hypothetical protein [Actinomadura graeca]QXJ19805.1 ABC transporter permease [Actinomadura graeca]
MTTGTTGTSGTGGESQPPRPRRVPQERPEGGPGGGGMRGAVAAEWTKMWSVRSTGWVLAAAAAVMALVSAIEASATAAVNSHPGVGDRPAGVVQASGIAAGAVDMVQFVVLALAILTLTGEYATGSIRTTLQCVPVRRRMMLAKAAVVAAVVFPAGIVLNLAGTAAAYPALGRWGRLGAGALARDAAAMGVYLVLAGLLILGAAAALRSTAATLTSAVLFLLVLPVTLANSRSRLLADVGDALPSSAGRYLLGGGGPYPAWAALLVLVAWTAAGLWGGAAVLRRRDA